MGSPAILAVLLVVLAPSADPDAGAQTPLEYQLIDMVVAQVDSTVVTFSELMAETRLVLLRTGGPELARAGELSPSLLSAVLRSVVVRELVLGEVRRLKLRDVPEAEVRAALDTIRRRFVNAGDYERFLEKAGFAETATDRVRELDAPSALVAIVTAELLAERFLDVRVRRNVVVRDPDVFACYQANHKVFQDRNFADVKAQIRLKLEDEQRQRAMETLVGTLEKRSTVRYAPGFEPPPRPPEQSMGWVCPEVRAGARENAP